MSDLIAIVNPQAAAARRIPTRLVDAVEKELADVADVVSPPAMTTAGAFLFWRLGGSDSPRPRDAMAGELLEARFGRYVRCPRGVELT